MSLFDQGCLVTGPSNIGKSELALSLIDRGHALVSDDVTEFYLHDDQVWGRSPDITRDFLEIRDLGMIHVRNTFGEHALRPHAKLLMIIELRNEATAPPRNRLQPTQQTQTLLGHAIPCFTLNHSQYRPRELVVETLVKTGILSQSGYDASKQLLERHQHALEANTL